MSSERKSVVKYGTVALLICCICYFTPNYAQYQVSPLGAVIMEKYGLATGQLSLLFSAPMIPAIFLSLAAGLWIDKLGPKMTIGAGLVISAAGCIGRVLAAGFPALLIATALTGISACFITAGAAKIMSGFYGADKVGSKMGILMAASTGGMTVAMATSARFASVTAAFRFSAVLCVAVVIVWFLFMKNPPMPEGEAGVREELPTMKVCLQHTLKSKGVWISGFCLFFIMAANVVISSFTPMALASKGIDSVTAGNIASFITIGNFLGCFVAPICISKAGKQKPVLIAFAVLAALGLAFSWRLPNPVSLSIAFLITGTFLGGMIPILMSVPVQLKEIGPLYAGTAGGVIGTIQVLGAVLIPSYVIAPIAGNSFSILFILGGVCMILAGGLVLRIKDIV